MFHENILNIQIKSDLFIAFKRH